MSRYLAVRWIAWLGLGPLRLYNRAIHKDDDEFAGSGEICLASNNRQYGDLVVPAHNVIGSVIRGAAQGNGLNRDIVCFREATLAGFDSNAARVADRKRWLLLTGRPIGRP
jgi:hypothetical protein